MEKEAFVEGLIEVLDGILPGESAHMEMDPIRPEQRSEMSLGKIPKQSAVLILWHYHQDKWQFPLIQRPVYNGTHSGQIALPGGKQELEETFQETALRETHEEIGVTPDAIEVIGQLSDIYIPPSNFNIKPIIGITEGKPLYQPDQREVVDVFDINEIDLIDDKNRKFAPVKVSQNMKIQAPCFDFDGRIVWGATAMILSEMAAVIKEMTNSQP
ncbi:NUDIX hydrolase [Reichenbachiella versicolor]|uniref:NUDIX hydrolase n=1 Tax=Reichenbachiella versicolor TaxID=1821036 RepID=UPI000D6EA22A|nr:CoA pyrophosphatase [Reichenbachiella versicolor]